MIILDTLSSIICYHNDDFFVLRKPNSIPTTFGKDTCFLDVLMGKTPDSKIQFSIPQHLLPYIDLPEFSQIELKKPFIDHQIKEFGKEHELGLLNRLDNETAGFLYFAKNKKSYERYKKIQSEGKVHKRYIAQVKGKLNESAFEITIPIMHHKYKEDRMVFVRTPKDKQKGRSKIHNPSTIVKVLQYNQSNDVSTLLVGIYKGVRHQIRVHLAGVGYPVVGDTLYGEDKTRGNLCLWSVGFQIQE